MALIISGNSLKSSLHLAFNKHSKYNEINMININILIIMKMIDEK